MYNYTKYDMQGNVTETIQRAETIQAPPMIEYPDVVTQLDVEEWDLRDSTNPIEALKDREDWLYA